MKRSWSLLLAVMCIGLVHAQEKKPLTLTQAVMEGRSVFAPQSIKNLKWIPGTEDYSYVVDKGADIFVMRGFVDGRPDEEITSLNRIKNGFNAGKFIAPEQLPNLKWFDKNRFSFQYKGQFWMYDIKAHQVARNVTCIARGINHDLAPSGTMAALTYGDELYCSNAELDSIRITTAEREGVVSGQAVHRYEFGISKGTFWSPNSEKLAFYVNNQSDVSEYSIMNYYSTPAQDVPFYYPMAGGNSERVEIYVYDVKKSKAIVLKTGLPAEQYLTNVTWGPESKYIYVALLNRGQDHLKLVRYDANTGEQKNVLFEEKHERYVEPEHGPFFLEGTKDEFLWFSERDGYQHLYRYDTSGKLLNQVTDGDRVILSIKAYNSETEELHVSATDTGLDRVLYSVNVKSGKMKRLTSDSGAHRTQVNEKTGYFIDEYSSVDTPRKIGIYDNNGKLVKELLNAKDPLRTNSVGQTEIVKLKSDDGVDLYARMIKPSDFNPKKKYPVLVYVYGGPHAQLVTDSWLAGASLWMHTAAEKGMIVFTVDGRGSANRGLDFEQSVFRNLGTVEMADQMTGVNYLKTLPYVDSDNMVIHGWSFGGFMTCSMMLRNPGVFKAGVAGGPVTDWHMYEVMYTERYMDTPEENPDGYANAALYQYAPNLEGELLLIHGTSDDVVVMQHSMTLLNAFINAEKQVEFFPYPGHAHNVRGKDRVHLMTKVLDFVEENMGLNK